MDPNIQRAVIKNREEPFASNLNEVFESYGLETLEAKVPLVDDKTYERIIEETAEKQIYAKMILQSDSATAAVQNRPPRTRNKTLKLVEINGQQMLSVGEERERSPVDKDELDDEIDQYMKDRAKLKEKENGDDDDEEEEEVKMEVVKDEQ